jgi:hypothetical protein
MHCASIQYNLKSLDLTNLIIVFKLYFRPGPDLKGAG